MFFKNVVHVVCVVVQKVIMKTATIDDAPILATIHVPAEEKAYAGIVDADYLAGKTIEDYTEKWTGWMSDPDNPVTVAISYEGDTPAGFICWGPLRTPPPGTSKIRPAYPAEIYAIHVHPDFWKQGHGRALMAHAAQEIKAAKQNAFCLWVLEKNQTARGFYDKLEGRRLGKRMIEAGPTQVRELCYGWRDISILI